MCLLHRAVVENFDGVIVRAENAPLFLYLIIGAEVGLFVVLVVAVCRLLVFIIPFQGSVAVGHHEVVALQWFPAKGSAWISAHARSIADRKHFSFIEVVHLHFSVCTPHSHHLLLFVCFYAEGFSVHVPEKINNSTMALI